MLEIQAPKLQHFCTLEVEVGQVRTMGMGRLGQRRIIPIVGGRVSGPHLNGKILPGGGDWMTTTHDGVAIMEARYAFETDDGALIEMVDQGFRHGPEEVMRRVVAGEPVSPGDYYMRSSVRFETGHPGYSHINRTVFVSTGAKTSTGVQVSVFAVL